MEGKTTLKKDYGIAVFYLHKHLTSLIVWCILIVEDKLKVR